MLASGCPPALQQKLSGRRPQIPWVILVRFVKDVRLLCVASKLPGCFEKHLCCHLEVFGYWKNSIPRAREACFSSPPKQTGINAGKTMRSACMRRSFFEKVSSRVHGRLVFGGPWPVGCLACWLAWLGLAWVVGCQARCRGARTSGESFFDFWRVGCVRKNSILRARETCFLRPHGGIG